MIPPGVETGYEARFDFPPASGPQRPYLLASVLRTGSTYLTHLLWETGCLGAPLEYLNFEPAGPYGHAAEDPVAQTRLWHNALQNRVSPNGVFGLKAFPNQFNALQFINAELVNDVIRTVLPGRGSNRVIELRRRDRRAHIVSYARAMLSGVWRKVQEKPGTPAPRFDARAAEHAARLIEEQQEVWQAMYRDLRIEPMIVWYEDVVADPHSAVGAVADYLGVALDPGSRVAIPAVERQSREGAEEWMERLR